LSKVLIKNNFAMKNSLLLASFCFLLVGTASAQISLSFSAVSPTCNGYTNGSASVEPSGGTAPYTFAWQTGQTGPNLIGIAAGEYQVTVTDNNNNTASGSVSVTQPAAVVANINADVDCNGQSGTLTAVTSGGTGNYTYLWSTTETTSAIQISAPGNYFVTVADANQCSDVATAQVAGALNVTLDVTQVRCFTDPNSGALHVNVLGGAAPYTYLWNDGTNQSVRQNLPAGTYTVMVTDANSCTALASATLVTPPPLTASIVSVTPSCGGANNGSATIIAVGGTPPYTHTWTPGNYTGTTVTGLAPGQYYVCTFDSNQCQLDLWVMIPEINNLAVNLSIQSAECTGVNDGVATALVVPPGNYQYQWNVPPFSGVTQITGLAANTLVAVTVTDPISGCTGVDSAIVGAHTNMLVTVTDSDIPCEGQNIGTATATASGGTPQYTYVWTAPPGNTTIGVGPNISGLAAGAYMVSATDSRGCTAIGVADIDVLSSLNAQIGGFMTIECGEDSTLVQFVNLSTDAFSTITGWSWILTGTDGTPHVYANISPLQVSLPVGDTVAAMLVVTSDAGCVDTASQQLIVPGIPDITLSTGPTVILCQNNPVYIEVSGGQPYFTYTWSPLTGLTLDSIPPNATAFPDTTTTYQLIANNQGCADTVKVEVIRVTPIELTVDESEIHTCDSTVVLQAFSNVTNVIWVDPAGNPVGNPPGNPVTVAVDSSTTYTAIATDANGCADSIQVTVIGHDIDVSVDPALPGIGCANTPIPLGLLNHNPGDTLQYTWSVTAPLTIDNPNSANPNVSGPAGNYVVTVTVTNQFDCTETLEIPVVINPLFDIDQSIAADLCNGLAVQFTNNSGLSGVWDFGDNTTSVENNPLHIYGAAGQFHVVFTPDLTICTMPWDSTIQVFDTTIAPPVITYEYVNCINQADIQFNGTSNIPNVTWAWTFEGGMPPTAVQQNPLVTFTEEGTITASLLVTDINGCSDSSQTEVEIVFINDQIPDSISYCNDTTVVYLNPDGFDSTATYVWTAVPSDPSLVGNDPNPGVSPLVPTIYTVIISQGTQCSVTYTVVVTPEASPDLALDPNFPGTGCENTQIPLGVINNIPGQVLTYQWNASPPLVLTGANTANPTVSGPAGSYIVTVTVTNQANCTDMLEVPVIITDGQSIEQDIIADLCDGTNVQFFNNSGLSGTWNFGDGSTSVEQNPIHQYSAGGQYLVTFTPDNAECTAPWDSLITVYESALQPPVITHNYVDCIDEAQIQFNGTSNIPDVTWAWTFEGGTPPTSVEQNPLVTFTEEDTVTVWLVVTDVNGCKDSSVALVEVLFINDQIPDSIEFCIDTTLVFLNPNGFDSTATYPMDLGASRSKSGS
jgi:PKD repeat protein